MMLRFASFVLLFLAVQAATLAGLSYLLPMHYLPVYFAPNEAWFVLSSGGMLRLHGQWVVGSLPPDTTIDVETPSAIRATQSHFDSLNGTGGSASTTTLLPPAPLELDLEWAKQPVLDSFSLNGAGVLIVVHWRSVTVPWWMIVVVLLTLPVIRLLITLRRRRRVAAGCCTVCGYDLRGTPDRCPECGKTA